MTYPRPHWGWFLCLFVLSLPLFFGLFFGLNYKDCSPSCFASAPNGASTCGDLINQVNGYNPAACAANNTTCPEAIGTICEVLQYMSVVHNELLRSNVIIILQSIMHNDFFLMEHFRCNCYCCSSTNHRQCTLRCPTCYSVTLIMSYSPYNGYTQSNVPYTQDFSQDSSKAEAFLGNHAVNSTTKCYYNPKSLTELSLDVSFTAWKWAITALFGMIPILFALGFTIFYFCCYPLYAIGRLQCGRRRDSGKPRAQHVTEDAESRPAEIPNNLNVGKDQDEAPPPYEKEG
ncbi:hypothetical protein DFS33DRAFT_1275733 [Desarmillaria ectypa]|nr:hypothetical protein DFS33DRAFT_1275733 [Desarmillaria ectypa]